MMIDDDNDFDDDNKNMIWDVGCLLEEGWMADVYFENDLAIILCFRIFDWWEKVHSGEGTKSPLQRK